MSDVDAFVRGLELPYAPHKQGDVPLFPPEQMRAFAAEAIRQWEAQKWRPIEEAPKDGTEMIVWFRNGIGAKSVLWTDRDGDPASDYAHWHVDDNKHGPYPMRGYRADDATHFQPLPEPPKETT